MSQIEIKTMQYKSYSTLSGCEKLAVVLAQLALSCFMFSDKSFSIVKIFCLMIKISLSWLMGYIVAKKIIFMVAVTLSLGQEIQDSFEMIDFRITPYPLKGKRDALLCYWQLGSDMYSYGYYLI